MKNLLVIFLVLACNVKDPIQKELLSNSTPEAEGISSSAIQEFIEAAEKEQPDALHSLMIVRHEKTVAE